MPPSILPYPTGLADAHAEKKRNLSDFKALAVKDAFNFTDLFPGIFKDF